MADNNQNEAPANGSDYKKYITYALIALVVILITLGLWYLYQHSSFSGASESLSGATTSTGLGAEKTTLADSQPHDGSVSFLNRDDALKGLDTAFKH